MAVDTNEIIMATVGGMMIGLAVTIMLLFKGRVTGISGITYNTLVGQPGDGFWRASFLLGLLAGGLILSLVFPQSLENTLDFSWARFAVAGLLVGFGTKLGSGCTSGHGVCGISRFSLRSIIATLTFMAAGILTVAIFGGAQ